MTTAITRTALFRSFSSRSFALVWAGQTLSRVGDFLYQVALAWWVLEKTGSATAMAKVLIFSFAPMLVFLLIGGVAVDRLPRIGVMFASDIGRGVVMAAVAALAFAGALEIWHLYVASLVFGVVDSFFQPAYVAAVPELVPEEHLPSAQLAVEHEHAGRPYSRTGYRRGHRGSGRDGYGVRDQRGDVPCVGGVPGAAVGDGISPGFLDAALRCAQGKRRSRLG
jgi:MFS family permease